METQEVEKLVQTLIALPETMLRSLHNADHANPVHKLFVDIVYLIKTGDYAQANSKLSAAGIRDQTKKTIQKTVNTECLYERSLEWAKPGVMRTFRFWTPEQKREYVSDCVKICDDLKSIGLDACLGFGSVLSFVRDRDLIPHDDDLDIIVAMPPATKDFVTALNSLKKDLIALGYQPTGKYYSHFHVRKAGGSEKVVDIFVGIREEEFVTWFPGPRAALRYDEIFPPLMSDFLQIRAPFPKNVFEYLAKIYGPDWHQPQPLWNHKWELETVKDLVGDRTSLS